MGLRPAFPQAVMKVCVSVLQRANRFRHTHTLIRIGSDLKLATQHDGVQYTSITQSVPVSRMANHSLYPGYPLGSDATSRWKLHWRTWELLPHNPKPQNGARGNGMSILWVNLWRNQMETILRCPGGSNSPMPHLSQKRITNRLGIYPIVPGWNRSKHAIWANDQTLVPMFRCLADHSLLGRYLSNDCVMTVASCYRLTLWRGISQLLHLHEVRNGNCVILILQFHILCLVIEIGMMIIQSFQGLSLQCCFHHQTYH